MNQPQNEPTTEQIHQMIWDRADDLGGYWIGVITDYHKHLETLLAEKDAEIERLTEVKEDARKGQEIVQSKLDKSEEENKALRELVDDAQSRLKHFTIRYRQTVNTYCKKDCMCNCCLSEKTLSAIQAHKEQDQ